MDKMGNMSGFDRRPAEGTCGFVRVPADCTCGFDKVPAEGTCGFNKGPAEGACGFDRGPPEGTTFSNLNCLELQLPFCLTHFGAGQTDCRAIALNSSANCRDAPGRLREGSGKAPGRVRSLQESIQEGSGMLREGSRKAPGKLPNSEMHINLRFLASRLSVFYCCDGMMMMMMMMMSSKLCLLGSHWLPRTCWWKQGNMAGSHWGLRY